MHLIRHPLSMNLLLEVIWHFVGGVLFFRRLVGSANKRGLFTNQNIDDRGSKIRQRQSSENTLATLVRGSKTEASYLSIIDSSTVEPCV